MLEKMSRCQRSLLSLSLTALALAMSSLAFCTSYWCEGSHKVAKPLCLSPVKMKNCGQNNSQPYTTESPTLDPKKTAENVTLSPEEKEEQELLRKQALANAVQYIWETGEDKYMMRYFHTGFWVSCEEEEEGELCRSFIELIPKETQGVLWLSVVSECAYIGLLAMGFVLMWVEVLCLCGRKEMYALKINSFAAICTVLSGLMGMVAHMMYTTVFQVTVSSGPKDWRPQSWDYGWSFALAWISFSCCMGAAVFTLNSYTKTLVENKHRNRVRLAEARTAIQAPSYDEVLQAAGGVYSVSNMLPHGQKEAFIDPMWEGRGPPLDPEPGVLDPCGLGMMAGGCGAEGCVDCEREMDEMDDVLDRDEKDEMASEECERC